MKMSQKAIDVPFFELESILAATKNFSNVNKLGQGGFGPVYKARSPGGQEIAVKRLSSGSGQGLEEFRNEVVLIAKLQLRNLVRFLGYCVEGDEKILLYENMPNKSLDCFLFDRNLCLLLDWNLRYNIILGIARGLLYLHQDSSGYIAPEYALDGLFSFKSDVFSFSVVVLEIVTRKRNVGFYQPEQSLSLLGYVSLLNSSFIIFDLFINNTCAWFYLFLVVHQAWNSWKEGKALELLDVTLCRTCKTNEFLKCVNVGGLLCVQEDPSDRPSMSNVLFMLASETATLPSPKQPAFIVRRCPSSRASSSSKHETCSNNGLTVSTLEDGR